MTLAQAVALWLADQTVSDCRLWGWSIRSLGRIGKVLQFLSAATIVVEIIGFERFSRAAEGFRLHFDRIFKGIAFLVLLILNYFLFRYAADYTLKLPQMIDYAVVRGILAFCGGMIFTVAAGFITGAIVFVSFRALQFASDHPRLNMAVQLAALTLLVLGFSLDLLAS